MIWLILPTYDEAGNVERVVAAARAGARARGPRRPSHPRRRRRLPRRDGGDRRPRSPPSYPAVEVLHRTGARGPRARLPRRLRRRAARRRRARARDGRRPLPRPGATSSRLVEAARGRRPRARLALRPTAAACRDWGPVRRIVSRGGLPVRARGARPATSTTSPAASSASAARCSRRSTSPHARSHGYVFQVELTYRAVAGGLPRPVEVPITFRDRAAGTLEDVLADRAARPSSWCRACAGAGAAARSARRCARCPTCAERAPAVRPRAADHRGACDSTSSRWSRAAQRRARRSGAGMLAPWPDLRGWLAGSLAIAFALLASVLVLSAGMTPDTHRSPSPASTRRSATTTSLFLICRNSLVLALHSLSCLAGFIAHSQLPAEAQRYSGFMRTVHDQAGPRRDRRSCPCATLFSLATQALVLAHGAATISAQLGISPAQLLLSVLAARDPGADRAVPAARRLDRPEPPGALGRDARRHARHHRARGAGHPPRALVETYVSPQLLVSLAPRVAGETVFSARPGRRRFTLYSGGHPNKERAWPAPSKT